MSGSPTRSPQDQGKTTPTLAAKDYGQSDAKGGGPDIESLRINIPGSASDQKSTLAQRKKRGENGTGKSLILR
jgi:hypothetical protein